MEGGDSLRWYHWITVYMIIAPWFLLAVIPEGLFKGWVVVLLILCVVLGVLGTKYLPGKKEDLSKYYKDSK